MLTTPPSHDKDEDEQRVGAVAGREVGVWGGEEGTATVLNCLQNETFEAEAVAAVAAAGIRSGSPASPVCTVGGFEWLINTPRCTEE